MKSQHFSYEKLDRLVNEVLQNKIHANDLYEVAALLESMGWNDSRVVREFGMKDIFELAQHVLDMMDEHTKSLYEFQSQEKPSRFAAWMEMLRSFLRGLVFAFPMAVSVIAMLNLKFSLWSYKYFALEQATSIAIGTIFSFVVVGGFTQAIARRGFFYMIQGYFGLAKKSTFQFIWIGFGLCTVISILMVVLNLIFSVFPYRMIFLIVVFFFLLTSIWLSVTVMNILKKEMIFTGFIILGIFMVYVFFEWLNIDILIAQFISLCIVTVLSLLVIRFYFAKEERKEDHPSTLKLPKFSIILYSIWPYFFYGFLYFAFLFMDRVNAWSKNESFMPYVIWFRGNYELGLDFALLIIIIPMGLIEVIVNKMMIDIEVSQKGMDAEDSRKLGQRFVSSYWRKLVYILIGSLISTYLIYRLTLWYNQFSIKLYGENLLNNEETMFVFYWGMASYILLAICLMNAVILFSLSQPQFVIKSILPAMAVNMVVGFLLSRWIEYEYAVFGLLFGTIVMLLLSTYYLLKVLRNLDYYLYAAS